ncbi:hypothetical protein [Pediococcus pentosaceus]|uniref:hypothetical protein n=1 Tax=Pediococcus pentosaceus TaxID=1255 RepID=UPI000C07BDCE|nr:hypothetical protein [Pediococcus pentosaceus]
MANEKDAKLLLRSMKDLKNKMLPSTIQNAGLMQAKDKRTLDSIAKYRTGIPNGESAPTIDVTDIKPGLWVGWQNITGLPKTLQAYEWLIDVNQIQNGSKLIRATNMATGSSWKKVIITGDTSTLIYPRDWQREYAETILWEGDLILTEGAKITLIDSFKHFDSLIFEYRDHANYGSARVHVADNSVDGIPDEFSFSSRNVADTFTDDMIFVEFNEVHMKQDGNNVLDVSQLSHVTVNFHNGVTTVDNKSQVILSEIIGVR